MNPEHMNIESSFLSYSVDKLKQLMDRIDFCLRRLNEDQIWARGGRNQNAVGNLVLHLAGNVGQWIVAELGGNLLARDRDAEFAARGGWTAAQLSAHLLTTVEQASQIIARLSTAELTHVYTIQNYQVSGVEVVYHVVEHFSGHAGQIIFATKMLATEDLGFYRHLNDPAHTERVP